MRKEDFNEWLESDVTRKVFQYWEDLIEYEAQDLVRDILQDERLTDVAQAKVAARYVAFIDMQQVLFDEIESFYNGDNDEGTRQ